MKTMKSLYRLIFGYWNSWQDFAIFLDLSKNKYLIQVREHTNGRKQFKMRKIHSYATSITDVRMDLLKLTAIT